MDTNNDQRNERIAKLTQRFSKHSTGRPKTAKKIRGRDSFYLDTELTEKIDKAYKDLSHELYPKSFSKSLFLETMLEFGLSNIAEIKSQLSVALETEDNS